MELTKENTEEFWKEIIRNKTLLPVGLTGKSAQFRAYLQFYKTNCQVVVKFGREFYNFNLIDANDEVKKYQSEKNIIE